MKQERPEGKGIVCIVVDMDDLLSNLLTPISAQLLRARAHDSIGWGDVALFAPTITQGTLAFNPFNQLNSKRLTKKIRTGSPQVCFAESDGDTPCS